jgi:hypothetical protein
MYVGADSMAAFGSCRMNAQKLFHLMLYLRRILNEKISQKYVVVAKKTYSGEILGKDFIFFFSLKSIGQI